MRALRLASIAIMTAAALAGCSSPKPVTSTSGLFYVPVCNNGPLTVAGTTWYLESPKQSASDLSDSISPGDGQGTLTVYSDGRALFVSMGGAFKAWLTTDPTNYEAVCG